MDHGVEVSQDTFVCICCGIASADKTAVQVLALTFIYKCF